MVQLQAPPLEVGDNPPVDHVIKLQRDIQSLQRQAHQNPIDGKKIEYLGSIASDIECMRLEIAECRIAFQQCVAAILPLAEFFRGCMSEAKEFAESDNDEETPGPTESHRQCSPSPSACGEGGSSNGSRPQLTAKQREQAESAIRQSFTGPADPPEIITPGIAPPSQPESPSPASQIEPAAGELPNASEPPGPHLNTETSATPAAPATPENWQSLPTTSLQFKLIRGFGKKKISAVCDQYPTLGDLDQLRQDKGIESIKGISKQLAEQVENLLIDAIKPAGNSDSDGPHERLADKKGRDECRQIVSRANEILAGGDNSLDPQHKDRPWWQAGYESAESMQSVLECNWLPGEPQDEWLRGFFGFYAVTQHEEGIQPYVMPVIPED